MSDSLAAPWTVAHRARLSVGFPGKNTGVGCRFLLQGVSPTQGLNLTLPHWQVASLPLSQQGSPTKEIDTYECTAQQWASLVAQRVKNLPAMQET